MADPVEVDQPGVRLRPPADRAVGSARSTEKASPSEICASPLTSRSRASSARSAAVVEPRRAAAEADLVQPHPGPHQHREGARRDLGIERAGVAGLDPVELGAAVGDQPGEQVEPPGRALGVGDRRDVRRQRQPLDQRHDVDAALLEHRAAREVDPVHLEVGEPVGERRLARQERGAHPEGARARAAGRGSPAAPGPGTGGSAAVIAPSASMRRMPCDGITPSRAACTARGMVGLARFELTTFRPPVERATRLRYSPTAGALSPAACEGKRKGDGRARWVPRPAGVFTFDRRRADGKRITIVTQEVSRNCVRNAEPC